MDETDRALLALLRENARAPTAALARALVMITVGPKRAAGVEAAIRKMPDVRALHSVSGPFDIIAEAATASIGAMDALIDQIGELEGVERTTSSVILSTKFDR